MSGEIVEAFLSWRTALALVMVFGFAPRFVLRLIVQAFHCDDPRRQELIAELHAVPRWERPFWVFQQLEVALIEGIGGRIRWAATGRIIDRWHFGDGVKSNLEHPTTFEIPSDEDKAQIDVGDTIKAMFLMRNWGERMWLEVVEVKRRHLVCRLVNHPLGIPKLNSGDMVKVKDKHIIDVEWHDVDYTAHHEAERRRSEELGYGWAADLRSCGCRTCVHRV